MKRMAKTRMGVDICLTVLLPVLMAEILTGQEFHEWAGVVMAAFFIIHHVLNRRWWKNIWKGGYKPVRFVSVMLNLLMLADISALAVSGIMMNPGEHARLSFLRTAFVFWDETKTAFLFFAEEIAMMGLFIAIGYYGSKLLTGGKCGQIKQKVLKCLAFLVSVLLCAAVILWIGFGNQNNPSDSWSVTAEDPSDTEEDGPAGTNDSIR